LNKSFKKITFFTTFFLIIIGLILASINSIVTKESDESYNSATSNYISKAILGYMIETGDYDLKFGEEKSEVTVESIITNLQNPKFTNDNYVYLKPEEYTPRGHYFFGFIRKDLGWRVVVNKTQIDVNVEVNHKNELVFVKE